MFELLKKKGVKNIRKFSRGHRSIVYIGKYKGKEVAIKVGSEKVISNEVKWLKILKKYRIGPKLFFSDKEFFVYEFVDGIRFVDYIKKASKKDVKKAVKNILRKMRLMDKLKIEKKEMHHPIKHILIRNKEVKMIDFERCRKTDKPKNVTQFCQFLMNVGFIERKNGIKILKEYKKNQTGKNFNKVLKVFT